LHQQQQHIPVEIQQQLNQILARHAEDAHHEWQQEAGMMNNPLHYFVPNPVPPEPDYNQFNIQFQHHF
jgi:hypothetical protein